MMKVLDLDMDFFLTDACPLAPLGDPQGHPVACPARQQGGEGLHVLHRLRQ